MICKPLRKLLWNGRTIMQKQGIVTVVALVALAAIGGTIIITMGAPQQDQSATLPGLEQEQRGDVIPGEQPAAEDPSVVGPLVPETSTAEETTTGNINGTISNDTSGPPVVGFDPSGNQSGINATGADTLATDDPSTESDNPFSDLS